MERVLVTGGTGFIGFEFVRHLCAAGLRPRLLVRRPHRAALLTSFDVDLVQGDLLSPPTLERAVEGVDTIFHLGARASFEAYRRLRARERIPAGFGRLRLRLASRRLLAVSLR